MWFLLEYFGRRDLAKREREFCMANRLTPYDPSLREIMGDQAYCEAIEFARKIQAVTRKPIFPPEAIEFAKKLSSLK